MAGPSRRLRSRAWCAAPLALTLLLGACGDGAPKGSTNGGDERSVGTGGGSVTTPDGTSDALYPLADGARWQYAVTFTEPDGSPTPGAGGTQTYTVESIEEGDGYRDAHIVISSTLTGMGMDDAAPSTTRAIWRFLHDGTMTTPQQSVTNGGVTTHVEAGQGQVTPSFDQILSGERLTGHVAARGDEPGVGGAFDWISQGKGTETVTVPAGTFEDAAKLVSTVTYALELPGTGTSEPVETTQWFARGTGLVKQVIQGMTIELVSTEGIGSL